MATFKELEEDLDLYNGYAQEEFKIIKKLTKKLYGRDKNKYEALQKSLETVEKDIAEYSKPACLEPKILKALTKELYKKNRDRYVRTAIDFEYRARQHKNHKLSVEIICNWIVHSDFKDPQASAFCNNHCTPIKICETTLTDEQKCNIFMFKHKTDRWGFSNFLKDLAEKIPLTMLNSKYQLNLINNLILPTIGETINITPNGKVLINQIIDKINISEVSKSEFAKILVAHKILNKQNLTKILNLYPAGTFKAKLKTAQVLGLDKNPEYWANSLESDNVAQSTTELPIFE